MKSKKEKMSRNRERKSRYAALADKSSRNETTLDGPIIGHFETIIDKERFGDSHPHEVLVQDGKRSPKPKTETDK